MIGKNRTQNEFDLPLKLSMALSQNPYLLNMFTSLTPDQREGLVGTVKNPHVRHERDQSGETFADAYRGTSDSRRFE